MEWTIPEISNLRCRWRNICLDTIWRQMVCRACERSWGTGWYACFLCSQEWPGPERLNEEDKEWDFLPFKKHRINISLLKGTCKNCHKGTWQAFSIMHDIRASARLIVGLSHSVHCCLLLKQQKNPTWLIHLFSCLWYVKVSDFTWSHDGTQALISYRDGFVLVGSVSGQRHWSSEINLESQITCGIWTPDDQQVMKMGHLGVPVGLHWYAIEYTS